MSANDRYRVTQITAPATYCRRYNGATYDDYDSEAWSIAGTGQFMHQDTADVMYWGHSAAFYRLGFKAHTAGSYGARTWEYWNGSAWTAFTPVYEGTSGFSTHGYWCWDTLSGWAATTVDSVSAYWIRCSVASVTTAAKFYNFLPQVMFQAPIILELDPPVSLYYRDVNGTNRPRDVPYTGPQGGGFNCRLPSLKTATTFGWENMVLFWWWRDNRKELKLEDLRVTSPVDPTQDAVYKSFTGYLDETPPRVASPAGQDADSYRVHFTFHSAEALLP